MKALFDTNILIDYLNGVEAALKELELFDARLISSITWMETLIGAEGRSEERLIRAFLNQFILVNSDEQVCEIAIKLRRQSKLKLPDAIVWASAKFNDAILVTRNSRDFPSTDPGIRIPYQL